MSKLTFPQMGEICMLLSRGLHIAEAECTELQVSLCGPIPASGHLHPIIKQTISQRTVPCIPAGEQKAAGCWRSYPEKMASLYIDNEAQAWQVGPD